MKNSLLGLKKKRTLKHFWHQVSGSSLVWKTCWYEYRIRRVQNVQLSPEKADLEVKVKKCRRRSVR